MKREKEIRRLLGNDYHLSIEMQDGKVMQWVLFKNYMDSSIYFSENNKAIMRSGLNTEEELYEFAKKHNRKDYNDIGHKVIRVSLLSILVLSIINLFVDGIFTQIVYISDFWLLIWMFTNHKIFCHNWDIDMLELEESWQRRKNEIKEHLDKEIEKVEKENNELR